MGSAAYPAVGASQVTITVPYVASFTPNLSLADSPMFDMLVTGDVAVQSPALLVEGQEFTLRFRDDGSGGHSITFPGSMFRGSTDTPLNPVTTAAGKTYYFAFKANVAASKVDFVAPNKGFA